MESSTEPSGKRGIFDVHKSGKKSRSPWRALRKFIEGKHVINLRPNFRVRHPFIWMIACAAIVAAIFIAMKKVPTNAEVRDFFPTTCLGDWQNASHAEGSPDTVLGASSTFSADNAAVYVSGTEIYCGGFIPSDFSASGTLTSVGVTLRWQVGDEATSTGVSVPVQIAPQPGDASTSGATTDSTTGTTTDATTSDQEQSSTSSFIPPDWFSYIISPALAQDAQGVDGPTSDGSTSDLTPPPATPLPEPDMATSAPADNVSSGTVSSDTVPTDTTTDSIDTTTADLQATSDTSKVLPIVPPGAPDENFLEVDYSTNGEVWTPLQRVNLANWPNLTVAVPIKDWADLANLKIMVKGIASTQDPTPPVYLDSMIMEVQYATTDITADTNQNAPHFYVNSTVYTEGEAIAVTGAPPGSFIEIYSASDPTDLAAFQNDYAITVDNNGETSVDTNTLPPGKYVFVSTFESGACNSYTLQACRAREDYVAESPITILPASGDVSADQSSQ